MTETAFRIVCALAAAVLMFVSGVEFAHATAPRPQPVCIVVHANGVPAPASCSNPQSYQVTDGK